MRLHAFHGGLHLDGCKHAADRPSQALPLPAELRIALSQHAGEEAECCVVVGQRLTRGELLGVARTARSAAVHSPCDGEVLAIENAPLAQPGMLPGVHVRVRVLAAGVATSMPALQADDPAALRQRIADAGIVGLGGGGFPTAAKLGTAVATLIINGAECEPHIACDDRLLRERADQVLAGSRLLAHAVGAQRILLAVEDSMPEACAAVVAALAGAEDVAICQVPTVYPQGGERQLIRVLTGLEVPRGGRPTDIGLLVHNVATAAAVFRAVVHGEALTHRWVSVSGAGVTRPGVFEVALGTSIASLIEAAGGYREHAARLLLGGPMMGLALPHDDFPLGKLSNAVVVLERDELRDPQPEQPCIRCADCADACPAQLLPQQLLQFTRASQWQRARDHGLFDCIECGCCDLVCPSHIPLVEHFRYGKTEVRAGELAALNAQHARERHLARGQRMQRDSERRDARQAATRSAAAVSDAVQQALAKARARQAGKPPAKPT